MSILLKYLKKMALLSLVCSLLVAYLLACSSRSGRPERTPEGEILPFIKKPECIIQMPTENWPDHLKMIEKAKASSSPKKKKTVILTTGALNPVHKGHVKMAEIAKAYLETKGYEVLGAYLSPTHDAYVLDSKCKKSPERLCETGKVRYKLVDIALKQSQFKDWVFPAGFEVKATGFIDFPQVVNSLDRALNTDSDNHFNDSEDAIQVFYLSGADHSKNLRGFNQSHKNQSILVLPRKGQTSFVDEDPEKRIFVLTSEDETISDLNSTQFSKDIKADRASNKWEKSLYPVVAQYIRHCELFTKTYKQLKK